MFGIFIKLKSDVVYVDEKGVEVIILQFFNLFKTQLPIFPRTGYKNEYLPTILTGKYFLIKFETSRMMT